VLQGGEDGFFTRDKVCQIVSSIKDKYADCAVTLSIGEWDRSDYQAFYDAGADRYLLRHETADEFHYNSLHPEEMSFEKRMECLKILKKTGFQTGCGFMVGSPGQGIDELVEDLMFLDALKPAMIGIGPFIPANGTPFAEEKAGDVDMVLLLISLLRLRFPKALIPATTALATLCENGTERGILAGANVVMPNITPRRYAENYTIYNNKKYIDSESARLLDVLEERLNAIDRFIDYGRGDYVI
jgi:biotin synthase